MEKNNMYSWHVLAMVFALAEVFLALGVLMAAGQHSIG